MDINMMVNLAIPVLAVVAAAGGAKVTLNGTKKRVEKLETRSDQVIDRLARIETKLDILMEKK